MAGFPSSLPNPTYNGYGITPVDAVIRTDMDHGPARVRRRYTKIPAMYSVRWDLTQEQLATFQAWHKSDLFDGVAWFQIKLFNGLGEGEHTARFNGVPEYAAIGFNVWSVSAVLEIDYQPVRLIVSSNANLQWNVL